MTPTQKRRAKAALEDAISKAGGVSSLGRLIGVKQHFVSTWRGRGFVPTERAAVIERATGVEAGSLRPDAPWTRVEDRKWPNKAGRPVLDYAEV